MDSSTLQDYCHKWNLFDVQFITSTFTSDVYKVRYQDSPAVLKLLNAIGKKSEANGALVLRYFDGNSAVRLLNSDLGAHLLEFVDGTKLSTVVASGNDTLATNIICDVVTELHRCSAAAPDCLLPMERNFRSLFVKARTEMVGSIYWEGARLAEKLLATEQEARVLHGDIHHENIMNSSERGWLAIDPKYLFGERTYDIANAFYNPIGFAGLAESPEVIKYRCSIYSQRLKIESRRILQYAFAFGCLSAAWCIEDGQLPEETLRIANSVRRVLNEID